MWEEKPVFFRATETDQHKISLKKLSEIQKKTPVWQKMRYLIRAGVNAVWLASAGHRHWKNIPVTYLEQLNNTSFLKTSGYLQYEREVN